MPRYGKIEIYESSCGVNIIYDNEGYDIEFSIYNSGDCYIHTSNSIESTFVSLKKDKLKELIDSIKRFLPDEEESSKETFDGSGIA